MARTAENSPKGNTFCVPELSEDDAVDVIIEFINRMSK